MGNIAATDADYLSEPNSRYDANAELVAPAHPDPSSPSLGAIDELRAAFAIGPTSDDRDVRSYLIDNGVDAGRLVAKGYGDSRPHSHPPGGRRGNRRIEFVINPQPAP